MAKRSSHLTRMLIEGISSYSPYRGSRLGYVREYDSVPLVNVGVVERMDIHRAISILWERKELSEQEVKMLFWVMMDGRLSRRDISKMVQQYDGMYVDQRTISRRLDSAYNKISKFLGQEYQDSRVFTMVAKKMGKESLTGEEIDKIVQIWEKI